MQVFVVPTGPGRHELYCEVQGPVETSVEGASGRSWLGRLQERFAQMVHEAELREGAEAAVPGAGWWDRLQARLMGWVAKRIAEQRMLWTLRKHIAVQLVHPDDMGGPGAEALMRDTLRRDYERHRRWLIIDGVAMGITGPLLFFVPGPNLVAYYFAFRVVGHWLSMRGASQGLERVAWTAVASSSLTRLRQVLALDPQRRGERVAQIAGELGLARLSSFVERAASR